MDGQQIYDNFQQGRGTRTLEGMAEVLTKLKKSYAERAESIAALQNEMLSAWTGDSAAAASEGAGPLKEALRVSAQNFDGTVESMGNQSSAWNQAANSVEPVPPMPEKPSPWSTGLKAAIPVAGPFMAADDIRSYQEGAAKHNAVSGHNVAVMEGYTASTASNSDFPREYASLEPGSAVINLRPSTPNAISGELSNIPNTTHTSGVSGPVSTVTPTSGPVTTAAPNVNTPVSTGPAPTTSVGPSGPSVNTPNVTGTPGNPTTIAGTPGPYSPSGGSSTRNPTRSTGFGRSTSGGTGTPRGTTGTPRTSTGTGSERGTGLNQRAGSRLYGQGVGTGSGTGTGAGGAARGVGEGAAGRGASAEAGSRALGAGKGVGAGLGSSAAAAESAAAKGGAAAGSRGAMGGPVGAGGRRGEGAEDEEHQRASYLQENDPDEVFIGDLGRTAPPVIGE